MSDPRMPDPDVTTARIELEQEADGDITGSTSGYGPSSCHITFSADLRDELITALATLAKNELMECGLDHVSAIAHLSRIIELAGDGR